MQFDRTWKRPAPTARQRRIDVWIGLVTTAVCVLSVEVYRRAYAVDLAGQDWIMYALFGTTGLALTVRRSFPLTVLLVEAVLFILIGERQAEFGGVFTIQMIMFAALYAAWAWSRRTRELYIATAVVLVAMFGWLIWQFAYDVPEYISSDGGLFGRYWTSVFYSMVINVVYFGGAIAWGYVAWRAARERESLAEKREQERLDQERDHARALRDERVRIARDLHDVVAHHVSGIGVQAAGAARALDQKPGVAKGALGRIEESSRTAVTQMHQLVGLLREAGDDDGRRSPQPGFSEMHRLATTDEQPAVTFQQVGEPFDVPETVQVSMVRIAQESVANIRRHARRADNASITLRYLGETDDRFVEVEILDDGRGSKSDVPEGGYGLSGIRERVAMHGGQCEIGPRANGGFRVRARIPV